MAIEQRSLHSAVFDRRLNTYAVLDGAGIANLQRRLDAAQAYYLCLYRGNLEPGLREAAPFLVKLEEAAALTSWVLEGMWESNWGVAILSTADPQTLLTHLRKFLVVQDPDGKKMYFRFYDPRVLRAFLPTCNKDELSSFFGPVERFVMKGENHGQGLVFTLHSGQHLFGVPDI